MNRYRVRFWDRLATCWHEATLIADCEQQCRDWADAQLHASHRVKHNIVGDSLQVILTEAVAVPYVVDWHTE